MHVGSCQISKILICILCLLSREAMQLKSSFASTDRRQRTMDSLIGFFNSIKVKAFYLGEIRCLFIDYNWTNNEN